MIYLFIFWSYFCVFQECFHNTLHKILDMFLLLWLGHQIFLPNTFPMLLLSDLDSSACILELVELPCHLVLLHKLAVIIFVILFILSCCIWWDDLGIFINYTAATVTLPGMLQYFWVYIFANIKTLLPNMQKLFQKLSDNYPKDTSNHRSNTMYRIVPSGAY